MAGMLRAINPSTAERVFRAVNPLLPARWRLSSSGNKAEVLARYLTVSNRDDVYMRALSHWQEPSSVVLNSREPSGVFESFSSISDVAGFEEMMMLTDLVNYLPDDILTKVDRASMAVSLEARIPLLDHHVVEFAWKLPLRFKIRDHTGKWILRRVLSRYVPTHLIDRPKMGFGVPIGRWLRGPLREWAEELLSQATLRGHGFFEIEPIRTKWKEHLSGQRNWEYWLWDVLVFQDWLAHLRRSTSISQVLS
jgi:asparagine synthase (glutamine-hydrolysing)